MATEFKKGDTVKLVMTVPSGEVKSIRMNEDGVVYYQISWVDETGVEKTRWFEEEKLTLA